MRASTLISLALLLACGGEAPPQPIQLNLWHAYRGEETATLEALVAEFEAQHPTLRVNAVSVPFDAFPNKITAAIPRGNGPDLFIFGHDRVGGWAEKRLLEPLNLWSAPIAGAPDLLERFFKPTVEALAYEGGLYGLPLNFKTLALFYDKALVSAPETTDALIAAARALRQRDPRVWGLGYEVDSLYFHAPWLHAFGGAAHFSPDGALRMDLKGAGASMRFAHALRAEIIPPEADSQLITGLFYKHQLAFVISGPWFIAELKDHPSWGVAPLPLVNGSGQTHPSGQDQPAGPYLGVEGLFMSSRSAHKPEAFALMRFLTDEASAKRRLKAAGQLVANRATYADPEVAADPVNQAFQRQVEQAVPLSNSPHMQRLWTPMQRALSLSVVEGVDPTESLAELVKRVEESR
ncbi:extracellular solute-binding protein [Myxococcota bacterium]|nr:extracellular solute-binding protein [Myxococcota bacterium]MBU1897932.1 extracellular solute-binding protein [Myxococcota bacterium]